MKFPNSILLASLSIIAISLSSVSAQAYPDLGSAANFVSNLTFGGSGCPFLDHDYPTYDMSSVRYWKLRYPQLSDIKAGPNESIASSRRFCQASINVSVPDGWKFALSKFAHNGFAKLETGTYVKQRVVAYYSGEADQSNSSVQFNPPINHTVSASMNFTPLLWSDCGEKNRIFNLKFEHKLFTDNPSSTGSLQTEGYEQVAYLVWEKCDDGGSRK